MRIEKRNEAVFYVMEKVLNEVIYGMLIVDRVKFEMKMVKISSF